MGVVHRRRILVLRRLPVGDRDDDALGGVAQRAAGRLIDLQIRDDPAAAVEIDEHGKGPIPLGRVDPRQEVPSGPGDQHVVDLADRLRHGLGESHGAGREMLGGHLLDGILQRRRVPRVFGRQPFDCGRVELGELIENGLHHWIFWHDLGPPYPGEVPTRAPSPASAKRLQVPSHQDLRSAPPDR